MLNQSFLHVTCPVVWFFLLGIGTRECLYDSGRSRLYDAGTACYNMLSILRVETLFDDAATCELGFGKTGYAMSQRLQRHPSKSTSEHKDKGQGIDPSNHQIVGPAKACSKHPATQLCSHTAKPAYASRKERTRRNYGEQCRIASAFRQVLIVAHAAGLEFA